MPVPERDAHSGAILFRPTRDEQDIADLKKDLSSMKDELAEKLAQVDKILQSSKKKK